MSTPTTDLSDAEALNLLAWYVEAGADEALSDAPIDRFEAIKDAPARPDVPLVTTTTRQRELPAMAPSAAAPAATAPAARRRSDPLPSGAALESANALARGADSLEALKAAIESFEGCGLKNTATHTVFADGLVDARVMLIGEAPGRDEDRVGKPFVGRSGQLLDRMFQAIGLSRKSEDAGQALYISNILPWRPPGNRTPSVEEMALCMPFILRHIELAQPEIVVALGGVAAKQLLETTTGIMRLRGRFQDIEVGGRSVPVLPMFHPAYLLRTPAQKRYAWSDLQALKARLESLS